LHVQNLISVLVWDLQKQLNERHAASVPGKTKET